MTDPSYELRTGVRAHLKDLAGKQQTITYQMLARQFQLRPPNTIGQITTILEQLMAEDAASGHPFIAALVIGKSYGGLPAPGFFQMAAHLGRDIGNMTRPDMEHFHESELQDAIGFWRTPATTRDGQSH